MSDSKTPEQAASELFTYIQNVEKVTTSNRDVQPDYKVADRKWILSTYADCMKAVKGKQY